MATTATEWRRVGAKFVSKGISTNLPDRMPPGKFALLQNVRPWEDGYLQPRPAAKTALNGTALPANYVHTLRKLNDPLPSAAIPQTLVVGVGTDLCTVTAGTVATPDTGYSGYALSTVPWRPTDSPESWLYLTDGARSRKLKTDGTNYQVGITPPNVPPTAVFGAPNFTVVDPFSAASAANWTNAGAAGSITQSARLSTTIAEILTYQTNAAGIWYAFNLTSYTVAASIQAGDVAIIDSGAPAETSIIQSVYNQSGVSTTVAAIRYDSGTTGVCTVQPTEAILDLLAGTILDISGEVVVVTEVDAGLDGSGVQTFRCVTTINHAAGAAIGGTITLIAFCVKTHAATADFVVNQFAFQVTVGTGVIYNEEALNLAEINGRPVQQSDYITLAINIDNYANFTYGQIGFGLVTTAFSSSPNVNYLTYQFQAGDLYPQVGGGWYLLKVPVSALQQVGISPGLSLTNVVVVGLSFTGVGTINVKVGSWWIGGTYGPLVTAAGEDYQYVYTWASTITGVESNPSPVLRVPVAPVNQDVGVSATVSSDPQVNAINWYRLGGSLSTWQFVGTAANSGTPMFSDMYSDTYAEEQETLVEDNYVPFPVQDVACYGTCNVDGTKVTLVSANSNFNTAWIPNGVITIGGAAYSTYGSPTSATVMQLLQSAGIANGVSFQYNAPVIAGVPLSSMWGPYNGTTMFACGDVNNPGFLYWTQGNNPDAAGLDTSLEVTSPSEPLIAGCMYNGRAYVFSNKRQFLITPNITLNAQGQVTYQVQDVPNSQGLLMRTGLCVADRIYFHGPDGIYAHDGQTAPKSLTNADLRILFPHDGVVGTSVVVGPDTLPAPDYAQPLYDQLSWFDNVLYFDYQSSGTPYTLALDLPTGGWYFDTFAGGVKPGIHYGEEGEGDTALYIGGGNGYVYQAGLGQDNGADMTCVIDTMAWDEGDARSRKYYADAGTRLNPAGAVNGISVQPFFDNYSASATAATFGAGVASLSYYTADILGNGAQGIGQLARNASVRISWTEAVQVQIMDWTGTWVPQPDSTYARGVYISDLGSPMPKFVQSLVVEANTYGVNKTLKIYGDGVLQQAIVINHNGQLEQPYSWNPPFIATELEVLGDQTVDWNLFGLRWVYDLWPYLTNNWISEPSDYGITGYKVSRYCYIPLVSTAAATLTITVDGVPYTYTVMSTGGEFKKVYVPLQAVKGKLWQFALTCPNQIRVMEREVEVWYKNVNGGRLQNIRPFGGRSAERGAEA